MTGEFLQTAAGGILQASARMVAFPARVLEETRRLLQPDETRDPLLVPREELAGVVRSILVSKSDPIEVVYVAGADYVTQFEKYWVPPENTERTFLVIDPGQTVWDGNFNLEIADPGVNGTLIVYAFASFLPRWERIQEDVARYLSSGRRQVVVALITQEFEPLTLASHSFLLSMLISWLPREKFSTRLEVYVAPEPRIEPERPLLRALRRCSHAISQTLEKAKAAISMAPGSISPRFSALVISCEPPR
jgi:hypothetical protein